MWKGTGQPNASSAFLMATVSLDTSCSDKTLTPSEAGSWREGSPGWPALRGGGEGRSWAGQLRTCFQLQTGADRTRR